MEEELAVVALPAGESLGGRGLGWAPPTMRGAGGGAVATGGVDAGAYGGGGTGAGAGGGAGVTWWGLCSSLASSSSSRPTAATVLSWGRGRGMIRSGRRMRRRKRRCSRRMWLCRRIFNNLLDL